MEKVVTFAQSETSEVWSPLSTGALGTSMAAKDTTGFSPINSSTNISSSHQDESTRPVTPTRLNPFSSTPFILSASTSSPNLLIDKTNQSVFAKYRDSPKSKICTAVSFAHILIFNSAYFCLFTVSSCVMSNDNNIPLFCAAKRC